MSNEQMRAAFSKAAQDDSWFQVDGTDERYTRIGVASLWFERGAQWQAAQQPQSECPHIVTSKDGTSYCRLAESNGAPQASHSVWYCEKHQCVHTPDKERECKAGAPQITTPLDGGITQDAEASALVADDQTSRDGLGDSCDRGDTQASEVEAFDDHVASFVMTCGGPLSESEKKIADYFWRAAITTQAKREPDVGIDVEQTLRSIRYWAHAAVGAVNWSSSKFAAENARNHCDNALATLSQGNPAKDVGGREKFDQIVRPLILIWGEKYSDTEQYDATGNLPSLTGLMNSIHKALATATLDSSTKETL